MVEVVSKSTGLVLVSFDAQHVPHFSSGQTGTLFGKQIAMQGVRIPTHLRGQFEGREVIYFKRESTEGEKALFEKAFLEIYVPLELNRREIKYEIRTTTKSE